MLSICTIDGTETRKAIILELLEKYNRLLCSQRTSWTGGLENLFAKAGFLC